MFVALGNFVFGLVFGVNIRWDYFRLVFWLHFTWVTLLLCLSFDSGLVDEGVWMV